MQAAMKNHGEKRPEHHQKRWEARVSQPWQGSLLAGRGMSEIPSDPTEIYGKPAELMD